MRAHEAGFTLLETVVTVGIAVILLTAGGYWMLSMRPGALRGALDDFDANLAAAKALAASSGNGATLVFAPHPSNGSGFTLTVFSGRPNAANAVTATNTMIASSPTGVSEAHFGNPPFAIFLNSAGYPTGSANYPTLDAQENPTFNVIAQQPPCPSGGIELTFTNPQGVTATRTLPCNEPVPIAAGTDPTPTPNAPHISPTYLLAHDTTDSGPLKFKAAEYGYYHWYASTHNGASCQTQSSDTGAAPAVFASPWPYAQPSPAGQSGAAPAPPALAPYTWPVGDPNDPPAWFQLSPVLHNGGMCTVTVEDDYNQSGTVTVQVMGDLTPSTTSLTVTVGQAAQTIQLSKTFDSQQLLLSAGGPCLGIVTVTTASGSFPSSPSTTPATGTVAVTPIVQGTCNLIVQDQYGEQVTIGVTVQQSIASWPQQLVLGVNGGSVGNTSGTVLSDAFIPAIAFGPVINALLGGAAAQAAGETPCYALGVTTAYTLGDNTGQYVDNSLPMSVSGALGIYVDSNGCEVDANDNPIAATSAGMIAYNPNNQKETYAYKQTGCPIGLNGWDPVNASGIEALLEAEGQSEGQCLVTLGDGATTAAEPDAGLVAVSVTNCTGSGYETIDGTCYFLFGATGYCELESTGNVVTAYLCSPPINAACETSSLGCYPYQILQFYYVPQSEMSTAFLANGTCPTVYANESEWTQYGINYGNTVSDTPIGGDGYNSGAGGPEPNVSILNALGLSVADETEAAAASTIPVYTSSGGTPAPCPSPTRPPPTPPPQLP